MTPREAFKFAFLMRCLEDGLDADGAEDRARRLLEKRSTSPGEVAWNIAQSVGGGLGRAVPAAGLAAYPTVGLSALLGGLGLGYLGGRLTDPGYDADDVKRQELISAYHSSADDMEDDLKTRRELAGL